MATALASTQPRFADAAALAAVVALVAAAQILFASGLYGTDDVLYALRGAEIASGIWRPSDNITEIRYGISIPIAAFLRLIGRTEPALAAWSFVCSLAEVALVFSAARMAWGIRAGVLCGILLGLTPLHLTLGTLALADAPLALSFSLSLVSLFIGERSRARGWYIAAGAAAGVAWWIKPNAAVPFALMFVGYALWQRTWKREWLLVLGAALVVTGAELAMYWTLFGDPLFGVKVLMRTFRETYVVGDLTWQSNSPWVYFRQLFIDGRETWLLPYFALPGIWLLARGPADARPAWSRFMLFWLAGLLCVFSFMIISVTPLKFIPKQENYASMFLAPTALVAGFWLARLRRTGLAICMTIFVAGAGILTGLESQRVALHYSTLGQTVDFSQRHPDADISVSSQAMNSGYLANLLAGNVARPENLSLIQPTTFDATLQSPSPRERFVVVDPSKPEFLSTSRRVRWEQSLNRCWQRFEQLTPRSAGPAAITTRAVAWLRQFVPETIDRQLRFTDDLIAPAPATVYRRAPNTECPDAVPR